MLLLPLSSLADSIGFARVYRAGIVLFVIGSVCCALSHTLTELVAARVLQGLGASALLVTGNPILRFAFPASMLGFAIGIQTLVYSSAGAAGPSLGGFILAVGSWPWLFWINVPCGLLALGLSGLLPAMPRNNRRFDWWSAVLVAAAMALFISGIDQLRPPGEPQLFLVAVVMSLILGWIAIRRQRALEQPFIAIDLLKVKVIRLSLLAWFFAFLAQNAALIALPFYFHDFGYKAGEIGLLLTPFPLGSAIVTMIAGWLSDRYHAGALGTIGLTTMAVAMVLLATIPAHPAAWDIMWRTALGGIGFGFFSSPNLRAMLHAAPVDRQGAMTGFTHTARLSGMTTGVALAALLFSFGVAGNSGSVSISALRVTLLFAAGVSTVAILFSGLRVESLRQLRRT
jgi:MFS transporter, DHA2 family, multidrug resistance protein